MSDNQFDDDLFDDYLDEPDEPKVPSPKELREYAKRQRAEAQKAREELAEFQKAQEEEKRTARASKVDDLIKSKGLDPVVKEMIGDNDPDEWFTKFGNAFKVKKTDDGDAGDDDTSEGQKSGKKLTPEQEKQLRGAVDVQPGTRPVNTSGTPDLSKLDGAKSLDEALAILAEEGLLAPDKSQFA